MGGGGRVFQMVGASFLIGEWGGGGGATLRGIGFDGGGGVSKKLLDGGSAHLK